jgi:ATP-binding cassette subfamily C (CFTR/MRP) protein 1
LDPLDKYSDDLIGNVLERVGLLDATNSKAPVKSLDNKVWGGGSNYSVGQQQLTVIGRALLANASVIICDEATAAVDVETDTRMRNFFALILQMPHA